MQVDRSCRIEPLDLFGLGRMWFDGKPGRECLQDHARFDAGDRMEAAIEMGAPGCQHSRLVIDVSQDAAGRWWAGYSWHCYSVPDGTPCGRSTPIDAFRGTTRNDAIRHAAAGLLRMLPEVPAAAAKAARVLRHWRSEVAKRAGLPA